MTKERKFGYVKKRKNESKFDDPHNILSNIWVPMARLEIVFIFALSKINNEKKNLLNFNDLGLDSNLNQMEWNKKSTWNWIQFKNYLIIKINYVTQTYNSFFKREYKKKLN